VALNAQGDIKKKDMQNAKTAHGDKLWLNADMQGNKAIM